MRWFRLKWREALYVSEYSAQSGEDSQGTRVHRARGRISGKRVIPPLRTSPASKRCLKHPPTQGWLEGAVPLKGSMLRMSSERLILSLTFKQPLDKLRVSRGVLLLDSL